MAWEFQLVANDNRVNLAAGSISMNGPEWFGFE
jgi:hypothetical protein